jgi:diguanylate cyclase (GGDEF)-like protein
MRPSLSHASVRTIKVFAFVLALAVTVTVVGVSVSRTRQNARANVDQLLTNQLSDQASRLAASFQRGRDVDLLLAQNPAFQQFYAAPGTRVEKVRRGGPVVQRVQQALLFLERLYPGSIGEACFIDAGGAEIARVVDRRVAPTAKLSPDESKNPFFAPTFDLPSGEVYQAKPYVSPDTGEWVVSNSTLLPWLGAPAIVHFELTIESFRRALAADGAHGIETYIVDGRTGGIVIDSVKPQRIGAPLGSASDRRFAPVVNTTTRGLRTVSGRRIAWLHIPSSQTNANDWYVLVAARPAGGIGTSSKLLIGLLLLLLVLTAIVLARRWEHQHAEAKTDALTGLGNRRSLLADLEVALGDGTLHFLLFDLDGFKDYNDGFGHQVGDALLVELSRRLADASAKHGGTAYRLGGDEFCVIAPGRTSFSRSALEAACGAALRSSGDGFTVSATCGAVDAPDEADQAAEVIRLADQRMYARKHGSRRSAGAQTTDVLLQAIEERNPELQAHLVDVADLAERTGRALGLDAEELDHLRRAAALHDVGKVAIPDEILNKPEKLLPAEWEFVRRHTVIGERIVGAAPALARAAKLIRWSHERWDGSGYPDGLRGDEIPLASRVIAVCDAYDAMTGPRPYRLGMSREGAIAELRRCAGSQFDPLVVNAFLLVAGAQATPTTAR